MRILLVEDDPLLGDGVQAGLRQAGFAADWVRDGIAARTALSTESFAALVLDLGLPRLSGLELLRGLRAAHDPIPVLILTARDTVAERILGLDAGADDYLVKPFDLDELSARLRALLRRSAGSPDPVLRVGRIELDPAAHGVRMDGQPVELSAREFALLHELMTHAGRVLSRRQLEERLYPWGEEVESNAVEVHVHHLRRKLDPRLIRTIRGVGYLLAAPGA
ncbi:MAG TPA: DNA-binding response regulator [Rhodocyclaceae bacterium]|nr:MAG: DNA-binding response regulator [Betaproteobacteria bacterium CG2_30_68_42]PIV76462.1 MAG: DNA-binding response regulator [Rhodocyclales bacterium CG17_big_fil_post_rev_8_21_14_2_50_68_7]PIX75233.1 MAG: DNA-binding response regulator [Rhodocyclales bacterium CG_4_10_14_3_um_filter_68_10]PJA57488.1 MAG: DNA-binding response regulator [Rhodocyclales bacterium CG_4_9_14_3_um_filter_68_10]HCX32824.1 DNA-binding response regulator [Rhodocyclaceae bacterium]